MVEQQSVFEVSDAEATLVGFRFPDQSAGLEAAGLHLHFLTKDRSRGGHVFDFEADGAVDGAVDTEGELRVELPPGVDLEAPELTAELRSALDSVERDR